MNVRPLLAVCACERRGCHVTCASAGSIRGATITGSALVLRLAAPAVWAGAPALLRAAAPACVASRPRPLRRSASVSRGPRSTVCVVARLQPAPRSTTPGAVVVNAAMRGCSAACSRAMLGRFDLLGLAPCSRRGRATLSRNRDVRRTRDVLQRARAATADRDHRKARAQHEVDEQCRDADDVRPGGADQGAQHLRQHFTGQTARRVAAEHRAPAEHEMQQRAADEQHHDQRRHARDPGFGATRTKQLDRQQRELDRKPQSPRHRTR